MKNFASVGKALIIQAVGIQENYVEEQLTIIDKEKSGCINCPHSFYNNDPACENCNHKCYVIQKIYHNEKNMYGNKARLKANALKMLIYLHFLRPDSNGIIKNVSIKELSIKLGCDERTITNNMKLLDEYGYIKFTRTLYGKRNILIIDYKNYFKKANEGGRGYVVLNKAFMEQLLSIQNINTLRIYLRNMVEIDSLNRTGNYAINVISKTYHNLQRELPTYCRRGVIKKAIPSSDSIFVIKHETEHNQVKFVLKDEYIGKKSRKDEINKLALRIQKFINAFNDELLIFEDKSLDHKQLIYQELLSRIKYRGYWNISKKDIYNIAELAEYYTYEQIEEAMLIAYEHYLVPQGKIESYGALIRTIIKKTYAYVDYAA